ncbi:hypothetical protein Q5752_007030 [Cryptotrichosporon argae]
MFDLSDVTVAEIDAIVADPTLYEELAKTYISQEPGTVLAPLLIGMFVDSILLGVTLHLFTQWWVYARSTEKPVTQLLVYWQVLFGVVVSGYTIAYCMRVYVYGFGTWHTILGMNWLSMYYVWLTLMLTPAEVFFAHRAYVLLDRSTVFAVIQALLLLCNFGTGIANRVIAPATILTLTKKTLNVTMEYTWLASGMAVDVLNTVSIAVALYRARTGWSETDALIRRLVLLTAETQLWPTVSAITYLVMYAVPSTETYVFFFVCVLKTYTISVLVVLNSRVKLRQEIKHGRGSGGNAAMRASRRMPPAAETIDLATRSQPGSGAAGHAVEVEIETETAGEDDEYVKYTPPISESMIELNTDVERGAGGIW